MSEVKSKTLPTEALVGLVGKVRERANIVIETELAKRGIEGIVPAHGMVLFKLFAEREGVPLKELVERTGRVKSTITGVVNTLVRHGYAEKRADESDGRLVLVRLTAKGFRLEKSFREISALLNDQVYGAMPEKDRRTLMKLLGVVAVNLEN